MKLTGWAIETRDLCGGPVSQLPALDRAAGALPAAGRGRAPRRHGAQRHRRHRRRRDFDLLRSDDRQARDPRADARRGDRRAGRCARCLHDRRHPSQHSVPGRADAASALARRQALDRLHRRGISRWLPADAAGGRGGAHTGRGRRRDRSCAGRAQAPHFRSDHGRARDARAAPCRSGSAATRCVARYGARWRSHRGAFRRWPRAHVLAFELEAGRAVVVGLRRWHARRGAGAADRQRLRALLSRHRGQAFVYTEREARQRG